MQSRPWPEGHPCSGAFADVHWIWSSSPQAIRTFEAKGWPSCFHRRGLCAQARPPPDSTKLNAHLLLPGCWDMQVWLQLYAFRPTLRQRAGFAA